MLHILRKYLISFIEGLEEISYFPGKISWKDIVDCQINLYENHKYEEKIDK